MNNENGTFGSRLREERRRLKLNQSVLARAGGVSLSTQVAYESGARAPDITYLQKLMAVGVDHEYLLSGLRQDETARAAPYLEVVIEILSAINDWEDMRDATVPFQKKMDLLRLNFMRSVPRHRIDNDAMRTSLRLIA